MTAPRRNHFITAGVLGAVIIGMAGLTAASVPLYRLFCQVTGYGGTTQVAVDSKPAILERKIRVRFDSSVGDDLPWSFQPVEREIDVRLGEERLAFYRAMNSADQPIVGTATFNVTPHKAGPYFSKIDCFCFTEQALEPGQSVDMPVSFFVDPAILDDASTSDLETITLSYTFFMLEDETKALVDETSRERPAS
ncbi:MAG: cytochrome c oxidase assembly protein [Geminicoccaceae bacterium]